MHTPGPWEIFPDGTSYAQSIEHGNVVICNVFGIESEGPANARLIRAAPDLLAACEAALDLMYKGGSPVARMRSRDKMTEILSAAIAKARGRQGRSDILREQCRQELSNCRAKLSAFSREWAECREDRENALNALDRCRKVAWGLFTWAAENSSKECLDGLRELTETQNGKMD